MNTITLSEFARFPAGRYRTDGPASGEHFRDDVLVPALSAGDPFVLVIDTPGVPRHFLDEVFAGLIRDHGYTIEDILEQITFSLACECEGDNEFIFNVITTSLFMENQDFSPDETFRVGTETRYAVMSRRRERWGVSAYDGDDSVVPQRTFPTPGRAIEFAEQAARDAKAPKAVIKAVELLHKDQRIYVAARRQIDRLHPPKKPNLPLTMLAAMPYLPFGALPVVLSKHPVVTVPGKPGRKSKRKSRKKR